MTFTLNLLKPKKLLNQCHCIIAYRGYQKILFSTPSQKKKFYHFHRFEK